jgi:hypothetical protein
MPLGVAKVMKSSAIPDTGTVVVTFIISVR